jgi:hypothetical protein
MRTLSLLALLIGFAGCDPIYGVSRRATVGRMPDSAKVRSIVQHTPGVGSVRYQQTEGSKPVTLGGIQPPTAVHTFMYTGGSDVHGVLQFTVDYRNRVQYSQTCLQMFQPPPQQWIDATLPVMKHIELRLQSVPGLSGLESSVVQRCDGVVCH